MTSTSLSQLAMTAQELEAFKNVVQLSFDAFKLVNYPSHFNCFINDIVQIVQMGCITVVQAIPQMSLYPFSEECDKLDRFLREAAWFTQYKKIQIEKWS